MNKILIPQPVGYWYIGDDEKLSPYNSQFRISVYKNPNLIHRIMMKLLLGINYEKALK